ncbi:alpha/beta hydrolase [Rugamonas sp.]|uniref:alpha/beta fold hydrolase n=1 Tax=Rugamonas sp. TaxID=1926287 RepID=UPI0025F624A1|nr:alpha/beta hydrolase [Rugamonas sp.]
MSTATNLPGKPAAAAVGDPHGDGATGVTTLRIGGVEVHIEGAGAETIVMIHGWPDTYRLWDAQVEALKADYRCVRFTLPGFDIDKERRPYSLDLTMRMFDNIIRHVNAGQRVILMVHDWGAFLGYQFAMRFPKLVSRIIGVDIGDVGTPQFRRSLSLSGKVQMAWYQIWLAAAWRIGGDMGERMTHHMVQKLKAPSDPQYISSAMNYPYYIQWTGAHGSYQRARAYAPKVAMLFIYGSKKPFMFHSPQWLKALMARKTGKVLAFKTGHWPMVEQADLFNREVGGWLRATRSKALVAAEAAAAAAEARAAAENDDAEDAA